MNNIPIDAISNILTTCSMKSTTKDYISRLMEDAPENEVDEDVVSYLFRGWWFTNIFQECVTENTCPLCMQNVMEKNEDKRE